RPATVATAVPEINPVPVEVILHKSHTAQAQAARPASAEWQRGFGTRPAQTIRAYVEAQAVQHGVSPALAVWIVKHQSSFNPRARGDGEASRGLWQISRIYHPEVTDATAFSVTSSTAWSLERIREGKADEWSTYHYCKALYKDCPF